MYVTMTYFTEMDSWFEGVWYETSHREDRVTYIAYDTEL